MNTKNFPDYGSDASKKRKDNVFAASIACLQKLFFAILLKRIYLRHITKRIMGASIVEIVRPMFPKRVKTTLLLLLWSAFGNCFSLLSPTSFSYDIELKE